MNKKKKCGKEKTIFDLLYLDLVQISDVMFLFYILMLWLKSNHNSTQPKITEHSFQEMNIDPPASGSIVSYF
jgi:hypothetical protein